VAKLLSEAQVQAYRRDGFLCPIDVLRPAEAARYRDRLEAAELAAGGSLPGPYRPHLVYTWAQELIRQPKILDAVEDVIGPDILAWESVFFTKEPQTEDYISWHQDITYWGLEAQGDVVTAWVALSPSAIQSGCMRVVPGTHLREVVPHFHGSHQNRAADRRIGFAIRYLPPHVHQEVGTDAATLVRGADRFGHFELEPAPASDLAPEAIACHHRVRDRRLAILMRDAAQGSKAGHAATAM
jgi:non-haem Fe2+, alpha-ketoglutarate-dependent halogenase